MFLSMNWIGDFVDLSGLDKKSLIHNFTLSTAEVEDIIVKGEDTYGVVVAKILSVENHPTSKKLHLLKVDKGDEFVDIVCGAPNVREGMKVALATSGGAVCGHPIAPATIAGFTSYGMCCSEAELGISDDNSGIWDITEDIPLGTDIKTVYDIDDIIFEVDNKSLTNRPDLWSHYGIAREFATITGRELKPVPVCDTSVYNNLPAVAVNVKNTELAYRYSAIKVENITRKVSPVNMRIRLYYCGSRAINFLADLTNYVMLEIGQPMHAFDNRKVDKIEVQTFDNEFKFVTLDGVERNIDENMLMITSGDVPVAIAGVMGGDASKIEDDTNSLLLESATFDGVSVRKTTTRLGLRTDASMRYEKMLDPELCKIATERLLNLLFECDGGAKVISSFTDEYVKRYPTIVLDFDKKYVDRYTGIDIPTETIVKTLTGLGFGIKRDGDKFSVTVPSWRATKDVTIKADIIEEITRIYGYDNFEIFTSESALAPVRKETLKSDEDRMKDILVKSYRLHEVHSYIWSDCAKDKELGIETPKQFDQVFTAPFVLYVDLNHRYILRQRDHINKARAEQILGKAGARFGFGKDHLIRAYTKQNLLVHLVGTFCDYVLNAYLLAKRDRHHARLKIARHTNDNRINIAYSKAGNDLRIGHVGTLAHGQIGGRIVDDPFLNIDGDHLHPVLYKLTCHGCSVSSQSEYCVCFLCFHFSSPLSYTDVLRRLGNDVLTFVFTAERHRKGDGADSAEIHRYDDNTLAEGIKRCR